MKRKIFSLLFALCLVVGMLPTAAFAETTVEPWDGSVAEAFAGGDGSESQPYEIATAGQFAYFASQIAKGEQNDAYYSLSADIDLSTQNWAPITSSFNDYGTGKYFAGSFNGQGHTINYKITKNDKIGPYGMSGLFGIVEGDIANLRVDGSITIGGSVESSYVGGLCGLFAGNLSNCTSNVDITLTGEARTNQTYFGGITGEMQNGTMKNCLYTGTIKSSQQSGMGDLYFGGITGTLYGGTIVSCKNAGELHINSGRIGYTGGIAGMLYTGGLPVESYVTNCYNEGAVSSSNMAGGIAGRVSAIIWDDQSGNAIAQISNCYSVGTVTGEKAGKAISPSIESVNYSTAGGTAAAETKNCYYVTGEDDHAEKVENQGVLYEKMAQNSEDGTWIKDRDGNVRFDWEFSKEPTPNGLFTATGDDRGTLSNVTAGLKYSVDNGAHWIDITDTTVNIENVTAANGVKIYSPGDLLSTLDSEIQTIAVTQASQRAVGKEDCTTLEQNDGKLTKVDATMEYRLSTESGWTAITGNTVTGLANGTYYVRIKANGAVLASPAAEVTIKEFVSSTADGGQDDSTTVDGGENDNTASPKTGDSGNLALWMALMFTAGITLAGTTIYRRKREYSVL